MKKELSYGFRTRMRAYYFRPCRVPEACLRPGEVGITSSWSVKTADPIPKDKIFAVMELIQKATVEAPVHIGDKVLTNVFGTDIVITKDIE